MAESEKRATISRVCKSHNPESKSYKLSTNPYVCLKVDEWEVRNGCWVFTDGINPWFFHTVDLSAEALASTPLPSMTPEEAFDQYPGESAKDNQWWQNWRTNKATHQFCAWWAQGLLPPPGKESSSTRVAEYTSGGASETPARRTASGGQMDRLTASISDTSMSSMSPASDADEEQHGRYKKRLEGKAAVARQKAEDEEEKLKLYNQRRRDRTGK
jgi:hypothetical protein